MKWTQILLIALSIVLLIIAVGLGVELTRVKKENHLLKQKIEQCEAKVLSEESQVQELKRSEQAGHDSVIQRTSFNDTLYPYPHYDLQHHAFGYPFDADTSNDFIVIKPQFMLSYCNQKNATNWVAWELNDTWVGSQERYQGKFITDTDLPAHFTRITHDHYTNSGFDRGHLVRSKDRSRNEQDNRNTFFMTNVLPQTPDLNRGVWLRFEDFCLQKATREKKNMYLIAGGIFSSDSTLRGEGEVAVPDSCYKIVVFWLKEKKNQEVTRQLEIIAVNMPNIQGIRNIPWQSYVTSVNKIEKSTGYDFLPLIPDSLEETLENQIHPNLHK